MPGQSGPGSNGNEGVLRIPQSPSITGTSPSDCLVSYPGHSLGSSYPSAEVQSVILQPQPTGQKSFYFFELLVLFDYCWVNVSVDSYNSHHVNKIVVVVVVVWPYTSHGAQCGVTTSHSSYCGRCVRDYHICFRLFAFVKSFHAHAVFERSTMGGWRNSAGSSSDG